jgi:hypothetical protein
MTPRPTRILRNLRINEVSGVDKGAGRGVKIMLMKRAHPNGGTEIVLDKRQQLQEAVMENARLKREAFRVWEEQVADICKRDGCSRSAAIDQLQQSEVGSRLWAIIKNFNGAEVAKLGDGTLPRALPGPNGGGGREPSRTHSRGHGGSPPADPFDSTEHHEGGGEALSRLRAEHGNKAYRKFQDLVASLKATNPSWSESKCLDEAVRRDPDGWQMSKQARQVFQPLSHDANSGRPAYGIPRYG